MKCPDCGAENIEGAAYCEDCGSKLSVAVSSSPPQQVETTAPSEQPQEVKPVVLPGGKTKCGACGAENSSGEAYCEDCGASIGTSASPVAEQPSKSETPSIVTPVQLNVPRLVIVANNKEFPINKDIITIGRRSPADGIYPDVDLTDDDPESYISRRHAQIMKLQTGQYAFEDIGSANGSFINTVRMTKGVQQELKENDELRLGKTELVFKAH